MRTVTPRTVRASRPQAPPPERGKRWAWFAVAILVVGMVAFRFSTSGALATDNAIRAGFSGACLDVQHSGTASGTPIDAAKCNGTMAQSWVTTATTIRQAKTNSCVAAGSDGLIVLSGCSTAPGQVWLRDKQGYFNPNSGECLDESKVGAQLQLASCSHLSSASEAWKPDSAAQTPACEGTEGETVACQAVRQWTAWQASGSNHEALLTTYTDGTPFEEWCADFVSYIYKQAGYPFTDGSADGWDENNANDVQYMGFTMHTAGGDYQPRAGDIAFFDYSGGHVEVVVSGGTQPTFVYGNSAQIDPSTGNGQMKANTVMQDGSRGGVVYYLSPAR